jgi:hypothetical protein
MGRLGRGEPDDLDDFEERRNADLGTTVLTRFRVAGSSSLCYFITCTPYHTVVEMMALGFTMMRVNASVIDWNPPWPVGGCRAAWRRGSVDENRTCKYSVEGVSNQENTWSIGN